MTPIACILLEILALVQLSSGVLCPMMQLALTKKTLGACVKVLKFMEGLLGDGVGVRLQTYCYGSAPAKELENATTETK